MTQAKKKYGQNFLKDGEILRRIAESADGSFAIVEIGAGYGDLTAELLARFNKLTAYEVDRDLIAPLEKRFERELSSGALTLICADILNIWRANLLFCDYEIAANLPYYIGTEIILRALADTNCRAITAMLQLEVAEKFCGKNGRNSLSLLAQSCGAADFLFEVGGDCFDPPPKVTSAVIRVEKRLKSYDKNFAEFLKKAFSQPRKKLAKVMNLPRGALSAIGVKEGARAHELALADYENLYKRN
ncbi:MAG: 16S rRNA (adenine(1518)-N(6)/adenine(1519)-N(6))-dimethyltransferase RsmA [Helicobacteraceae bacterium]|jgi:16S rRNA (adenine1518-N6/adenine1519-N6)-dimethyltransferase|nr:16S rRNA (adenine(1518)-N(6)/adenine(1519)-N(6))-dimethyltransferase RsmA [Helicobacteraceae bacterium]